MATLNTVVELVEMNGVKSEVLKTIDNEQKLFFDHNKLYTFINNGIHETICQCCTIDLIRDLEKLVKYLGLHIHVLKYIDGTPQQLLGENIIIGE